MFYIYTVLYINVDDNKSSEIYGFYPTKKQAVNALILAANYREKDGALTQYMRRTNDYVSMGSLYSRVWHDEFLVDDDIYLVRKILKKNVFKYDSPSSKL